MNIACPGCQKMVEETAPACPHCQTVIFVEHPAEFRRDATAVNDNEPSEELPPGDSVDHRKQD